MTNFWLASVVALWLFAIFLSLLVIGLYRQVGELTLSPGRRASLVQGLDVGSDAPAFSLQDQLGRLRGLDGEASHQQAVVIFGSPSCPPCASLADELASSSADSADNLSLLFVGGPDAAENRAFAETHTVSFPILTDPELATAHNYEVQSTPFVYVIEKGVIRAKGITSTAAGVRGLINDTLGKRAGREALA